jgi:dephospho-CoA kinase
MIVIGLTGGFASGKSLVAKKLVELGATLIDADEVAREVLSPGEAAFNDVVKVFGNGILTSDGEVNRKKLGAIIFSDAEKRAELNRLTHPRIRERMMARVEELRKGAKTALVVLDIPLLIESGLADTVDCVIVVFADVEQQLRRLMKRDNITEAAAKARLKSQMPLKEKLKAADYIIDNSGTTSETLKETEKILAKIKAARNLSNKG